MRFPSAPMRGVSSMSRIPAALHGAFEVIDREADVVDARAALFQELSDWRIGFIRFEQFDERVAGLKTTDPGAVAVGKLSLGHSEDIAIE